MSELTSQVEITDLIKKISDGICGEGLEFLNATKSNLKILLLKIPYDVDKEASIRWTRTAHQILEDRYVFEGKSCTDVSLAFIVLCLARDMQSNFVKVIWEGKGLLGIHCLVEVDIDGHRYIADPDGNGAIVRGRVESVSTSYYPGYSLRVWGRGKDSWALGLKGIEDESIIE